MHSKSSIGVLIELYLDHMTVDTAQLLLNRKHVHQASNAGQSPPFSTPQVKATFKTIHTLMSQLSTKKYLGNCHCGLFQFELEVPEIKSVTSCKCSICTKKGYLFLSPHGQDFKITRGENKLISYEFGDKKAAHEVCHNDFYTCPCWLIDYSFAQFVGRVFLSGGKSMRVLKM